MRTSSAINLGIASDGSQAWHGASSVRNAAGSIVTELDGLVLPDCQRPASWFTDRRGFMASVLAGSIGMSASSESSAAPVSLGECCSGEDPVACIGQHRFNVLAAFFEAQLYSFWNGPPEDSAVGVAHDALDFMRYVSRRLQEGLRGGLIWFNMYAWVHTGRRFDQLNIHERWALLNQGESPIGSRYKRKTLPMIRWDVDYPLHAAISTLALLGRLIINSRRPAQEFIGFTWGASCRDPQNLAHVPPPPYPDLSQEYDVCVIGSGAGGALVAARAAAAGKRVLILETGKWVSPDSLVERQRDANGNEEIVPARGDRVLKELYKSAGVQIAGGLGELVQNRAELLMPTRRRSIAPVQSMIVLQPQVVGGGPYVNNAIHLEILEDVWNRWPCRPTGISYAAAFERMQQIKQKLGVNIDAVISCAGVRSLRFVEGAERAGDPATYTPVSILPTCFGCGSDNSVDPFGMHTGGLHPPRPDGPNSYLMTALNADVPAQVAYQTRATSFEFEQLPDGTLAVKHLHVEDLRPSQTDEVRSPTVVRAKQFALCAGVVASTQLLRTSLARNELDADGLGEGVNGNVGAPVYAVYDKPIYDGTADRPEPGIAQCYFVRERQVQDPDGSIHDEPVLENWFHFPSTVALGLAGWFHEFAQLMWKYNHMAIAGMVVPTAVRPENRIDQDGKLFLEVNQREFELLLRGILRIGKIFLAGATPENGVSLYLPTRAIMLDPSGHPLVIRNEEQLRDAIEFIRCRGPAFMNLLTSHPQGGNALGRVVDPSTFRVQLRDGEQIQNLYVADASLFPAGCEVNPQLTVTLLASYSADSMLGK